MKIRMKSNSLRLRITQSELHAFCTHGIISEQIEFPSNTLHYHLRSTSNTTISATITDNVIEVLLPNSMKDIWMQKDQIGFTHDLEINEQQVLSITIEKDFKCLDERNEDESDNFPNPKSV